MWLTLLRFKGLLSVSLDWNPWPNLTMLPNLFDVLTRLLLCFELSRWLFVAINLLAGPAPWERML